MRTLKKLGIKLTRNFRYAMGSAAYHSGITDPGKSKGGRILIYHGVCVSDANRFHPVFITKGDLERQFGLFRKHFNVLPLSDYFEGKWSNEKFNLAITFDDGFANNHQYALPLLEKFEMPATFFVTAIRAAGYDILWNDFLAMLGKFGPSSFRYRNTTWHRAQFLKYRDPVSGITLTERLRRENFEEKGAMMKELEHLIPPVAKKMSRTWWQQMTPEQIRRCADSPQVTIGAHGLYHNDLAQLSPEAAAGELEVCRSYLESVSGKAVNALAFPYGSYTGPLVQEARRCGYKYLCAMDFLFPEDSKEPDLRERLTVNPFISPVNQLLATVSGRYENHPA